jgi:hypothetical protein
MFTKEQIANQLKPWGIYLDEELPRPYAGFAYELKDRETAFKMAYDWHDINNILSAAGSDQRLLDFICHQSDVIELLTRALSYANRRCQTMEQ